MRLKSTAADSLSSSSIGDIVGVVVAVAVVSCSSSGGMRMFVLLLDDGDDDDDSIVVAGIEFALRKGENDFLLMGGLEMSPRNDALRPRILFLLVYSCVCCVCSIGNSSEERGDISGAVSSASASRRSKLPLRLLLAARDDDDDDDSSSIPFSSMARSRFDGDDVDFDVDALCGVKDKMDRNKCGKATLPSLVVLLVADGMECILVLCCVV